MAWSSSHNLPVAESTSILTSASTSAPSCSKKVILTNELMKDLAVAKIFKGGDNDVVDSVNFTSDGAFAVTSNSDDHLNVYDCIGGTHLRTCQSKKYGCALATFTNSASNVLYASTKEGHELRYLSLHDNKFIRYFSGHTGQVTSVKMSPVNDYFLSSGLDSSLRLWDLRSPTCFGLLHLLEPAITSFDPEGVTFAIGISNSIVKLYDIRSFDSGPFRTFNLSPPSNSKWSSMAFSSDGERILINTKSECVYVIDAFHGDLRYELSGRLCPKGGKLDACFSADGKYVLSTSVKEDGIHGVVLIWDIQNGRPVCILNPHDASVVGALNFNPKMCMMISAGKNTTFWLPRNDEKDYLTI